MTNNADPELQKPTDLDLHYFQKQSISGFSRIRVKRIEIQILSFHCWKKNIRLW